VARNLDLITTLTGLERPARSFSAVNKEGASLYYPRVHDQFYSSSLPKQHGFRQQQARFFASNNKRSVDKPQYHIKRPRKWIGDESSALLGPWPPSASADIFSNSLLLDEDQRQLLERPVGGLSVDECCILQQAYEKGAEMAKQNAQQPETNAADSQSAITDRDDDDPDVLDGRTMTYKSFNNRGRDSEKHHEWWYMTREEQPPKELLSSKTLDAQVILEGWIILDRLALELNFQREKVQTHASDAQQEHDLTEALWEAIVREHMKPWVLQEWRKHFRQRKYHQHDDPWRTKLPTPEQVYPKLKAYLDLNLFSWSPHLINFILDAIEDARAGAPRNKANNRRTPLEVAILAQQVYDSIVDLPPTLQSHSTEDHYYNPDSEVGAMTEGGGENWNEKLPDDVPGPSVAENTATREEAEPYEENPRDPKAPHFEAGSDKPRYPDRVLISKMLKFWHKSGNVIQAPQQGMRLLRHLCDLYEYFNRELKMYRPDEHVFGAAILCWSNQYRNKRHSESQSNRGNGELPILAKESMAAAGPMALGLLRDAQRSYSVVPNGIMYEGTMKCLTLTYDPRYLNHAKSLLDQRTQQWKQAVEEQEFTRHMIDRLKPTAESYAPLIEAWVKSGQVHQAISLLRKMDELAFQTDDSSIAPTDYCVDLVQTALDRKVQSHGNEFQGIESLRWTQRRNDEGIGLDWERNMRNAWEQIDREFDSYSTESTKDNFYPAVRDAFALFDRVSSDMFRHSNHVSSGFLPWPSSLLDRAVSNWRQMRRGMDRGEIYLAHAQDRARNRTYQRRQPTAGMDYWNNQCRQPRPSPKWLLNRLTSYVAIGLFRPSNETLMFILDDLIPQASPKTADIPILATALVDVILEQCHDPQDQHFPDRRVFNFLIEQWKEHGTRQLTEFGEGKDIKGQVIESVYSIRDTLQTLHSKTQMDKFQINAETYANLVETWIELYQHTSSRTVMRRSKELWADWLEQEGSDAMRSERADGDRVSKFYHSILRAFSLHPPNKQDPEIQLLLERVLHFCQSRATGTEELVSLLLSLADVLAAVGEPKLLKEVMLELEKKSRGMGQSTRCCNTLIKAFATAREPAQAEKVLDHMLAPGRKLSQVADTDSWNHVLKAWSLSKSPDSASRAFDTFRKMLRIRRSAPNIDSFNLVLQCFSSSGCPSSWLKEARAIVAEMEKGPFKPNAQTYLTYMKFLKRNSMPDAIFSVLKRFCELCETGTINDRPDVRHFNLAILAYAEQSSNGSADFFKKANQILQMMLDAAYAYKRMQVVSDTTPFPAEPNEETFCGLVDVALGFTEENPNLGANAEHVLDIMVNQQFHTKHPKVATELCERILEHLRESGELESAETQSRYIRIYDLMKQTEHSSPPGRL